MQTFSFNPPLNLIVEGKWLLAVTSGECTNSVFEIPDENNSFSLSIPSRWRILNYLHDGVIIKLKELLEPREQVDIKLLVEEVRKRGNITKIGEKGRNLSDLGTHKNEIIERLKIINNSDLEDIGFWLEVSSTGILNILDMKYIDASTTGYTSPPGI